MLECVFSYIRVTAWIVCPEANQQDLLKKTCGFNPGHVGRATAPLLLFSLNNKDCNPTPVVTEDIRCRVQPH